MQVKQQVNKKEKAQKDIEDALNHEEHLQHDDNEDPITYVNSKYIESINLEHDDNEDPVTFGEETENEV